MLVFVLGCAPVGQRELRHKNFLMAHGLHQRGKDRATSSIGPQQLPAVAARKPLPSSEVTQLLICCQFVSRVHFDVA